MQIDRIHHVAYRCKDAKETVNWYKTMLNMDYVLAIAENHVPSTKEPDPYMHIFLDAGGGSVLAFFELPSKPPMSRDPNTPSWYNTSPSRLAMLRVVAILIGVIGALILTLSKSAAGSSLAGDAMIGAFILTWALLTIGIRRLDSTCPALFVVGVFGAIGCLLLSAMGLLVGRIDAILIPLRHFDAGTILWFDVELVLLLSLFGQLLQGVALRTLNVALVVALTSYGSIAAGLAASIILLGEHLSIGEIVAGLFLVTALALSLVPISAASRIFRTAR